VQEGGTRQADNCEIGGVRAVSKARNGAREAGMASSWLAIFLACHLLLRMASSSSWHPRHGCGIAT
jgi:hypothetical protein